MKTLTLIALLFASSSFAQIKTDKVAHFGVGYVAGSLTTGTALSLGNGKGEWWKSLAVGFGSGLIIGTGKELYDQHKYSGFNWQDLGATVLGSTLGSVTIRVTLKLYGKRQLL